MTAITWPCKQTAVYWPPGSEETGGRDFDDYGKPMYSTPVEISCRWDDKTEEMVMADGTRDLSRAEIIVDRVVKVRGVLLLDSLENVSDLNNPKNNDGAYEIRRVDQNPDVKATKTLIRAFL